jgi:hypothetical protein
VEVALVVEALTEMRLGMEETAEEEVATRRPNCPRPASSEEAEMVEVEERPPAKVEVAVVVERR